MIIKIIKNDYLIRNRDNKMGLKMLVLVCFITAAITLQAALKNGLIQMDETALIVKQNLYECSYAGLSCGCYTNNQGGCQVSCSPTAYFKMYNQTECSKKEDFVLAGFTHM